MRYLVYKTFDDDSVYVEVALNSEETKPTGNFVAGSGLEETDTGNIYCYDEKTGEWVLWCSLKEEE